MHLWHDLYASRFALFGFLIIGIGWASFSAQVPVIKTQVGLTDSAWGTLILLSAIGAICSMWLAPVVHGVLGRWSMLSGLGLMAAGFLICGTAQTFVIAAIGLVAAGSGSGVADVFANAEVSEAESETGRSLMNLNHGIYSLAYAIAAVLVGVAREAGLGPVSMFTGLALVTVLLARFSMLPDRRELEKSPEPLDKLPVGIVWIGGLVVLSAFLGEAASEGWSALHIERTLGGDAGQGALGPALLGAGMAAGRLGAHFFGANWPPIRVMIVASCVAAAGLVLAGMAWSLPLAYLGFALGGLGVSVVGPLALGLVGQAVPRRLRLSAIAKAAGLGYAGFLVSPVFMGFVSEGFGLSAAFYSVGVILLVVVFVLIPIWSVLLRRV